MEQRKHFVIAYNSSEIIGDCYETEDWKLALYYYKLLKEETKRNCYDDLKKAEKRGDFISLDLRIDDDLPFTYYKSIYRKEVKA